MDENIAWKAVIGAALFSLVVMGVVYFLIAPKESPYFTEEKITKIAEFSGARVTGRKEGKKIWEFSVKDGWTSPNREVNYLTGLRNGTIYNNDRPILVELTAPQGKAFQSSQVVELTGNVQARLDLGRLNNSHNQSQWARMQAGSLKFYPKEKRSELADQVKLIKKDSSILAERATIDHQNKVADLVGKVLVKRQDGKVTSNSLRYISQEERLFIGEPLVLQVSEGIPTKVKANAATFYSEVGKEMTFWGSLEVLQGKKAAVANEGTYSQARQELLMKGGVKAVFAKGAAAIDENAAGRLKDREAKQMLKAKTLLTSNELLFSTRSSDARASGAVYVTQDKREAKADQAVYDDKQDIITLTGNIYLKKGKEWVKAKEVVVSVKNETFTAAGSVEAEFKL